MQASTFDAVEYLPSAHAVHVVAPVPMPVSVMDPAAQVWQAEAEVWFVKLWYVPALQSVQDATSDAVEYLPPVHAVHVVAPVFVPLSVMDPAAQVEQSDC